MPISTARQLTLIAVAAVAPIALGIAMHLEHLEAEQACLAEAQAAAPIAGADTTTLLVPVFTPVPMPAEAAPVPGGDPAGAYAFAFVVDVPTPHLVLASAGDLGDAAFEGLGTNAPHYRGEPGDEFIDQPVWRDADMTRLPERARLAVGRHVRVYSNAGRVCVARVGKPSLISESSGTIDYLGEDDVSEIEQDGRKIIDPASLWDDGRRLLVAPLEGVGCEGGAWARDIALSEPLVYVGQDAEAAAEDLPSPVARRMVQRAPGLRPIVKAFAEHVAGFTDEAFTTRRFVDRLDGRRWIEPTRGGELDVFGSDGEEFGGCGGFDPAWAAIAIDGEGAPGEPVWVDANTDYVHAVFDLDGDGRAEVFAQTWLGPARVFTLGDDATLREIATLAEVPYFGCPC